MLTNEPVVAEWVRGRITDDRLAEIASNGPEYIEATGETLLTRANEAWIMARELLELRKRDEEY